MTSPWTVFMAVSLFSISISMVFIHQDLSNIHDTLEQIAQIMQHQGARR